MAHASSAEEFEFLPCPKRVRVLLGGEVIADSHRTRLLRRARRPPVYYFPSDDLRGDLLLRGERTETVPGGEVRYFHVHARGAERLNAAWCFERPETGREYLADYIAFEWGQMDAWFEEDLEVFVHARDPGVRVDIAPSSRLVEVLCEGVKVAESRRTLFLFETGLPVRYYLPRLDCRVDLLVPSDKATHCPYKGKAGYYSLRLDGRCEPDVAWYYRFPTLEAAPIASAVAFYQERLELRVDGERV